MGTGQYGGVNSHDINTYRPTFTAVVVGGGSAVWTVTLQRQYPWASDPPVSTTSSSATVGVSWISNPDVSPPTSSGFNTIVGCAATISAVIDGVPCLRTLSLNVSRNYSDWRNPYGSASWSWELEEPPEPPLGFWTNLRNAEEIA